MKQYAVSILPKHFVEVLRNWKNFLGVLFYPILWAKWDSPPRFILNIFTIWSKWVTTPKVCVIYPNSMIYLPVQFYSLSPVLWGVILSFNIKCLIMPYTTLSFFSKMLRTYQMDDSLHK